MKNVIYVIALIIVATLVLLIIDSGHVDRRFLLLSASIGSLVILKAYWKKVDRLGRFIMIGLFTISTLAMGVAFLAQTFVEHILKRNQRNSINRK